MKHFALYFDGGCKPNPGRGYGSFEIMAGFHFSGGYRWSVKKDRIDFGKMTSNTAEYQALLCALECLFENTLSGPLVDRDVCRSDMRIQIFSDSKLVVNQLNNGWRSKRPHLTKMIECARTWLKQFGKWSIEWHSRKHNVERFGH